MTMAGAPITFDVELWRKCVSGSGSPDVHHDIRLVDRRGNVLERATSPSDASGRWTACFTSARVRPGLTLVARAAGLRRAWRIPLLAVETNRQEDAVWVEGPVGREVRVLIDHRSGFEPYRRLLDTVLLPETDDDFVITPFNLVGGDRYQGSLRIGDDTVRVTGFVPFVHLTPGQSGFSGANDRGRTTRVRLTQGDGSCQGVIRGSATVSGLTPRFRSHFVGRSGAKVAVIRGDWVEIGGDICFDTLDIVPRWGIVVSGSATSDVVHGRCLDDAPYRLAVRRGDRRWQFLGRTRRNFEQQGRFQQDLTAQLNVRLGDRLRLTCRGREGSYFSAYGTVRG
jgi:hypothetical protein